MRSWIPPIKVILISAGAVSLVMALILSLPVAVSGIPVIYSVLQSWLKPPYLYLIINGIIITIAASYRFNHAQSEKPRAVSASIYLPQLTAVEMKPALENPPTVDSDTEEAILAASSRFNHARSVSASISQPQVTAEIEAVEMKPALENATIVDSEAILAVEEEKPLLSSRFGHRKLIRPTPEGGLRRVSRPKAKQDTLEGTWKMITDGHLVRHVPLTRHQEWDSSSPPRPRRRILRKESSLSLSQEELNRRVEAFINKFNEEMRIQRQESLKQFMEMMNSGL